MLNETPLPTLAAGSPQIIYKTVVYNARKMNNKFDFRLFKAKDFLELYIKYVVHIRESHYEKELVELKLRKLNSFLIAFKIIDYNSNKDFDQIFSHFENGEFLKKNTLNKNSALEQKVMLFLESSSHLIYNRRTWRKEFDLRLLFVELLQFRLDLEKLRRNNYVIIEGPGGVALNFANFQKGKIRKVVLENISEIDEVLSLIIDPKQLELSEKALIIDYNYPNRFKNK